MTTTLRDVCSTGWITNETPDAVVLFFHGFGSNEQDLSGLSPALGLDLPWASLRAPLELGNGRAAWFEIATPGAPDAAPVQEATAAIWAWIEENVDPATRIIPVGFSQGGLMASQLLRTRPERVIAPVILGGFVLGATQPGDEVLRENLPAVFWGRGAVDRVIAPIAITRTTEFLPTHSTLIEKVYPGLAHGINAAELDDVRDFITAQLGAEVAAGA